MILPKQIPFFIRIFAGLVVGLALSACATYQTKTRGFRDSIRSGNPAAAAAKIKEKAYTDGDDQVVYLLEYATAEQLAGHYDESTKAYLKAEDLTDIKDYHSISRITGSLLLNQGMVQYKGDDFEKVLINAMLAINFLMQGKLEEAQVECRKLNDKLYKFRFEGKKNYDQNPFAFYLSALIWESIKDWDTAYIDFKKAYDLNPSIPYLKEDLIRAAISAQRPEELAKWKKAFGNIKPANLRELGEVILVYQQGWGPVKRPNPSFPRVPKLYPTFSSTTSARLEVENGNVETTQLVSNITDVAIKTLDDQYAGLVASRVGGLAAKAVAADQIRQKNALLGELAWIGMNIADQADLRQWTTLPSSFQVAKIRLAPGDYRVRAVGLNSSGGPTGETSEWIPVKVVKRQKSFITWRSLN
ncbi:MAG: COG3014 family protein [Bdellovibrionales bacterium]